MGLMSQISSTSSQGTTSKFTKGTGLLAKAIQANNKSFFSFQEWCEDNNLHHAGIFCPVHGMMLLTHAYGIDSQTIEKSVSSKDFWNGTLKDNEVHSFTKNDNNFYDFLQFFSFDLRSKVSTINLLKFDEDNSTGYFSVLINFTITEETPIAINKNILSKIKLVNKYESFDFTKEKETIDSNINENNYTLYTMNLKSSVATSINSKNLPEENIKKAVFYCIYEQIFFLIKKAFPSPSLVSFKEISNLKIAYCNISNIDLALLQNHINLLLNDLLCNINTKPILIKSCSSNQTNEIISFLN